MVAVVRKVYENRGVALKSGVWVVRENGRFPLLQAMLLATFD